MANVALLDLWEKVSARGELGDTAEQRLAEFEARAAMILPALVDGRPKTHTHFAFPTVAGIRAKGLHKKYMYEAFFDTSTFDLMRIRSWLRSRLDADGNETWSLKILKDLSDSDGASVTYHELKEEADIISWFVTNGYQSETKTNIPENSPQRYCPRMITMFKTWRFQSVRPGSLKWWIDYSVLAPDLVYGCMTFSRASKDKSFESEEQQGDGGRSKVIIALGLAQDPDLYNDPELVEVSRLLTAEDRLCFQNDQPIFRQ